MSSFTTQYIVALYNQILGTDAQIVQFPLRPLRQIMCFSGAMAYMSDGMKMDVKLAGLGKTFGRLAGGGSLFQITYTNETGADGYIAMTPGMSFSQLQW